jgi:hypothetical protein
VEGVHLTKPGIEVLRLQRLLRLRLLDLLDLLPDLLRICPLSPRAPSVGNLPHVIKLALEPGDLGDQAFEFSISRFRQQRQ